MKSIYLKIISIVVLAAFIISVVGPNYALAYPHKDTLRAQKSSDKRVIADMIAHFAETTNQDSQSLLKEGIAEMKRMISAGLQALEDAGADRPLIVVICGHTGTLKSTVAKLIKKHHFGLTRGRVATFEYDEYTSKKAELETALKRPGLKLAFIEGITVTPFWTDENDADLIVEFVADDNVKMERVHNRYARDMAGTAASPTLQKIKEIAERSFRATPQIEYDRVDLIIDTTEASVFRDPVAAGEMFGHLESVARFAEGNKNKKGLMGPAVMRTALIACVLGVGAAAMVYGKLTIFDKEKLRKEKKLEDQENFEEEAKVFRKRLYKFYDYFETLEQNKEINWGTLQQIRLYLRQHIEGKKIGAMKLIRQHTHWMRFMRSQLEKEGAQIRERKEAEKKWFKQRRRERKQSPKKKQLPKQEKAPLPNNRIPHTTPFSQFASLPRSHARFAEDEKPVVETTWHRKWRTSVLLTIISVIPLAISYFIHPLVNRARTISKGKTPAEAMEELGNLDEKLKAELQRCKKVRVISNRPGMIVTDEQGHIISAADLVNGSLGGRKIKDIREGIIEDWIVVLTEKNKLALWRIKRPGRRWRIEELPLPSNIALPWQMFTQPKKSFCSLVLAMGLLDTFAGAYEWRKGVSPGKVRGAAERIMTEQQQSPSRFSEDTEDSKATHKPYIPLSKRARHQKRYKRTRPRAAIDDQGRPRLRSHAPKGPLDAQMDELHLAMDRDNMFAVRREAVKLRKACRQHYPNFPEGVPPEYLAILKTADSTLDARSSRFAEGFVDDGTIEGVVWANDLDPGWAIQDAESLKLAQIREIEDRQEAIAQEIGGYCQEAAGIFGVEQLPEIKVVAGIDEERQMIADSPLLYKAYGNVNVQVAEPEASAQAAEEYLLFNHMNLARAGMRNCQKTVAFHEVVHWGDRERGIIKTALKSIESEMTKIGNLHISGPQDLCRFYGGLYSFKGGQEIENIAEVREKLIFHLAMASRTFFADCLADRRLLELARSQDQFSFLENDLLELRRHSLQNFLNSRADLCYFTLLKYRVLEKVYGVGTKEAKIFPEGFGHEHWQEGLGIPADMVEQINADAQAMAGVITQTEVTLRRHFESTAALAGGQTLEQVLRICVQDFINPLKKYLTIPALISTSGLNHYRAMPTRFAEDEKIYPVVPVTADTVTQLARRVLDGDGKTMLDPEEVKDCVEWIKHNGALVRGTYQLLPPGNNLALAAIGNATFVIITNDKVFVVSLAKKDRLTKSSPEIAITQHAISATEPIVNIGHLGYQGNHRGVVDIGVSLVHMSVEKKLGTSVIIDQNSEGGTYVWHTRLPQSPDELRQKALKIEIVGTATECLKTTATLFDLFRIHGAVRPEEIQGILDQQPAFTDLLRKILFFESGTQLLYKWEMGSSAGEITNIDSEDIYQVLELNDPDTAHWMLAASKDCDTLIAEIGLFVRDLTQEIEAAKALFEKRREEINAACREHGFQTNPIEYSQKLLDNLKLIEERINIKPEDVPAWVETERKKLARFAEFVDGAAVKNAARGITIMIPADMYQDPQCQERFTETAKLFNQKGIRVLPFDRGDITNRTGIVSKVETVETMKLVVNELQEAAVWLPILDIGQDEPGHYIPAAELCLLTAELCIYKLDPTAIDVNDIIAQFKTLAINVDREDIDKLVSDDVAEQNQVLHKFLFTPVQKPLDEIRQLLDQTLQKLTEVFA